MADVQPSQLAEVIRYTELHMHVREYFSPKPLHKTHSYDDPEDKRNLYLNRWTIDRPLHSICNTLMHQCVHALNYIWDIYYFGHGDNNPEGKENTAPFRIAQFAQQLVANNKKIFETMIHEEQSDIQAIEETNIANVQEMLCEEGILCFHDHLIILGDEEQ